ncbi:hypothetical protein [Pleomorphovibrio marinus]|uniref:hypothetical protein n=1 Tax=Pleomorphovibrio marinus TaxID=2164132 RepID=UPI0013007E70|nr:hypothetical protein [Pleomorphovibrio marinus]
MKSIKYILSALLVAVMFSACESDYGMFNRDNRPDIPLMFTNTTSFGHDPFIEISESAGESIEFVIEIPENSGTTISQISKVGAGSTALNIGNLNNDDDYLDAPISGEGTRVVFTTTLEEFREKRPNTSINIPDDGFAEIAFLFQVELANGDELVSMRARARVSE